MARTIGGPPPEKPSPGRQEEFFEESFEIHVVTPLFGGGVTAGVVDATNPIRGTSIRGQLRFWWRATAGRSCTSSKELYERESALWGDTKKASSVYVAVTDCQRGSPSPCAFFPPDKNFPSFYDGFPSYALFPFQGKKANGRVTQEPGEARKGSSFTLLVRGPQSARSELFQALRAWICFGGLGARTRKGAGSLYCPTLSPGTQDNLARWLQEHFDNLNGAKTGSLPWPTLGRTVLIEKKSGDPVRIWDQAINLYKDFRQGKEVGRNPGREHNRPGRSRWPEADAIRNLAGTHDLRHEPDPHKPCAFPRASFGLPIITHFKDSGRNGLDPEDTELYPVKDKEKKDRMASPVIVKPLATDKTKAVALIAVLNAPLPDNLELHLKGENLLKGQQAEIITSASATYGKSPLKNRSPRGDAIEALIAFAKEQGFEEVTS